MVLNLFEKIIVVLKSLFSSFMSIELLIIGVLLFVFLLLNLKREEQVVKVISVFLYVIFFMIICLFYSDYTKQSIDGVIKYIMNYIYFPSLAMYFMIILFVTIGIVYTMFSKKLTKFIRYLNMSVFSILYILYIQVIGQVANHRIYFSTSVEIYKNDTILSLVQVSNLILFIWILFMLFYKLYQYFKKEFDERKGIS